MEISIHKLENEGKFFSGFFYSVIYTVQNNLKLKTQN
jgi:hypothetical protein